MTSGPQRAAAARPAMSARRWTLILLVGCAGLSGCQRSAQKLPEAPIFAMRAVPQPVPIAPPPQTPAPPQIPVPPVFQPFTGSTTIYFEGDTTEPDTAARAILDQQAEWLLRHPGVTAVLRGHADLLGSRARQFAIGEMRAVAMRRYLVTRGVPAARLQVTSFGKQLPVTKSRDEASQRRNRRGETIFRGVAGLPEQ